MKTITQSDIHKMFAVLEALANRLPHRNEEILLLRLQLMSIAAEALR